MNQILILVYLITFVVDVYLLVFSATRKDPGRSIYFTIFTAGLAAYSLGCVAVRFAASDASLMNSLRITNAGIPVIAPYFLLISLAMFQPKYLRRWMLYGSLIFAFCMFFLVVFNDFHYLYYTSVTVESPGDFTISRGVIYWIAQAFYLLCLLPAYILLFQRYIRGTAKLRKQMNFILVGAVIAFTANAINFSGLIPFDPTPVVLTIAVCLFAVNLAQYHILDIAAIASNTAVDVMSDALIIVDNDWGYLFCNNSAKDIFPPLRGFLGTEHVDDIDGWPFQFTGVTEPCEKEFEKIDERSGARYTYKAVADKIINERNIQVGWYVSITDMTDVTFLIRQLKDLATTDSLTAILNRRSFLERITIEMDMAERNNLTNALIMFDIDKFKNINDTYGHIAGDYILCSVVNTVKSQLRSYDIIARYGGEEFVIFTHGTEGEGLSVFANRLCKAIENAEYIYDGQVIPTTASFGTVEILPGDTFDGAMLAVDAAMYQAKQNGRNQVVGGVIEKK